MSNRWYRGFYIWYRDGKYYIEGLDSWHNNIAEAERRIDTFYSNKSLANLT